jgi:hypothetical protein
MSFHGLAETPDRSACVTSDPPGSRRSSRRCAESTTSSRPSGRKSMHIGNDATVATHLVAAVGAERDHLVRAPVENQRRPSCQRGDSPNTTPSIRTSAAPTLSLLLADGLVRQTAPRSGTHRTPPAPPRPPPESAPPPPPDPPGRTPGPVRGGPTPPPHWPSRRARSENPLKTPHDEDHQTRAARSSVAARTEYPVLERRCARATHCRRRTERRISRAGRNQQL